MVSGAIGLVGWLGLVAFLNCYYSRSDIVFIVHRERERPCGNVHIGGCTVGQDSLVEKDNIMRLYCIRGFFLNKGITILTDYFPETLRMPKLDSIHINHPEKKCPCPITITYRTEASRNTQHNVLYQTSLRDTLSLNP